MSIMISWLTGFGSSRISRQGPVGSGWSLNHKDQTIVEMKKQTNKQAWASNKITLSLPNFLGMKIIYKCSGNPNNVISDNVMQISIDKRDFDDNKNYTVGVSSEEHAFAQWTGKIGLYISLDSLLQVYSCIILFNCDLWIAIKVRIWGARKHWLPCGMRNRITVGNSLNLM